jgi:hypothetical protein
MKVPKSYLRASLDGSKNWDPKRSSTLPSEKDGLSLVLKDNKTAMKRVASSMKWDSSWDMLRELRELELEKRLLLVQALRFTLLVIKPIEPEELTHMLKSKSTEKPL